MFTHIGESNASPNLASISSHSGRKGEVLFVFPHGCSGFIREEQLTDSRREIYFNMRDVLEGAPIEKGDVVSFAVVSDGRSTRCTDIRKVPKTENVQFLSEDERFFLDHADDK